MRFEDTFMEYHGFVLRRNLQQALFTPKEELIKFNEQIGSPSQMGLLLNYETNFRDKNIAQFIEEIKSNQYSGIELQEFFFNYFDENQSFFLKDYAAGRKPIDLRFIEDKQNGDKITFKVEEKNNFRPPFSIGLVKNDSLIKQYKFNGNQLNTTINIATEQADYMVINPTTKLPEFNPRNNWKKLGSFGIKTTAIYLCKRP